MAGKACHLVARAPADSRMERERGAGRRASAQPPARLSDRALFSRSCNGEFTKVPRTCVSRSFSVRDTVVNDPNIEGCVLIMRNYNRTQSCFQGVLLFLAVAGAASAQVTFTEYPTPTGESGAYGIAAGPDGALWFAEFEIGKIGRITTAGAITEYTTPAGRNSAPNMIAKGPDGALWFTEWGANQIGRVTTGGAFAEYPIPTAGAGPFGIAAGPDGALWFTEYYGNKIGRIPTSGSPVTEYPIPTANAQPQVIAAGPDGALWFTETNSNKIGRITTGGSITEYTVPTASAYPFGIVAGPDGALWFTEFGSGKAGRITTTGQFTEYALPGSPAGIAVGPDQALWIASPGALGRTTAAGAISQYPTPGGEDAIFAVAGPDNAIWYTGGVYGANTVGRAAIPASFFPSGSPGATPISPTWVLTLLAMLAIGAGAAAKRIRA